MAKVDTWLKKKSLKKLTDWAKDKNNNISDIAALMGISASTFYKWKNEYEEIADAFEEGRKALDERVENAFFDMCTGFHVKVKKTFKLKRKEFNENGKVIAEYEELVEAEDEEYVPPSVAAQKFYLCNRMPDRYRPENAVLLPGDDEGITGVVEMPAVEENVIEAQIIEKASD